MRECRFWELGLQKLSGVYSELKTHDGSSDFGGRRGVASRDSLAYCISASIQEEKETDHPRRHPGSRLQGECAQTEAAEEQQQATAADLQAQVASLQLLR